MYVETVPMSKAKSKSPTDDLPAPALIRKIDLPLLHAEFRTDEPAAKYHASMHSRVAVLNIFMEQAHVDFFGTDLVSVNFTNIGVRLTPGSGAIVHRMTPTSWRVATIFDVFDETMLHALFAATGGKPVFFGENTSRNMEFTLTPLRVMGKENVLFLRPAAVKRHEPARTEADKKAEEKRLEAVRATPFHLRLARIEKVVQELNGLVESFQGDPAISASLTVSPKMSKLRFRMEPGGK